MSVEAVGEAVTGGLIARTLEPVAGEPVDGHTHETACLNCRTPLVGSYCHACGQAAQVHRTLGAFFHDLAHGVLHFEGKIFRTLPLLAWRPGELTRRYIEGERAKFVSPIALFLFSVFLMFAIISALGGPVSGGTTTSTAQERSEVQREFDAERRETLAALETLRAERGRLAAEGGSTSGIDQRIAAAERELQLKTELFRGTMRVIGAQEQQDSARTGAQENITIVSGADELNGWFNESYRRAKENPSLLAYKLQTNAYKFSWALIPISVPFVWLLFLHRRRYRRYRAYDHTVFVTYSIAFMTLGVIVLSLLRPLGLGDGLAVLAILTVPHLHMYRQLRGAYRLSRWSAMWRTFVLVTCAIIAGSLFFALLLTLGVL